MTFVPPNYQVNKEFTYVGKAVPTSGVRGFYVSSRHSTPTPCIPSWLQNRLLAVITQ